MVLKREYLTPAERRELDNLRAVSERADAQALFTAVVTDTLIDDFNMEGDMNDVPEN